MQHGPRRIDDVTAARGRAHALLGGLVAQVLHRPHEPVAQACAHGVSVSNGRVRSLGEGRPLPGAAASECWPPPRPGSARAQHDRRRPRSRPRSARRRSGRRGGSPELSAASRATPSARSASVRSVASVASTARPIAPPTCTVVLTKPEASPESLGVAPDIASVISAGKARPGAGAEQQHHRQDVDRRSSPSTGARANSSSPAPASTEARDQRGPRADAHDQPLRVAERQRRPSRGTRAGTRGRPRAGCSRGFPAGRARRGRTSRRTRRRAAPSPRSPR